VRELARVIALASLAVAAMLRGTAGAQGQPEGQLTIAFDASIAPTFLYAMHDALIKPLPGNDMAPCLAESWMYDRVMYGGIFEPATLHGIGPRVEEPGVGLSSQLYFTSPYEDMRLKKP